MNQRQLIPMTTGEHLKQARLTQKLSLAAVSKAIGLDEKVLGAIELEQANHLAPVYWNGYIRAYARFLEIPEEKIQQLLSSAASKEPEVHNVFSTPPQRNLLDIVTNAQHWVNFARHFGPPSGSDPKLREAAARYITTVFGYGSNMGPSQTARHLQGTVSARILVFTNQQHITISKLDAAIRDLIFISYSHEDNRGRKKWLDDFRKHLAPHVHGLDVCAWSDEHIEAGSEWL